jgi:3-hydroxy-9,10-secoandrosta-1,3,5(10)-triene-9,17-dione monooxygenase reductase component
MAVTIDEFRAVMSRWTTGITVVTARLGAVTHGMVASSFASVSTDPPTVLFCADRRTRTYPLVRDSGAFAVSILAQHQEDTFRVFAGQKGERGADKFASEEVVTAVTGSPILRQALAWFDCRVLAEYPGGTTHSIFVGEVVAADLGEGKNDPPLVYFKRAVRRLVDADP